MAFGAPGDRLPNLVADAPESAYLEVYGGTGTDRLLLRFDGFVDNAGQGALEMRGDQRSGTTMTRVRQRISQNGGGSRDQASSAVIVYEPQDGHEHWHLKDAARYSLWNQDRTAEVAPGQKVGFCLEDTDPVTSEDPSVYDDEYIHFCQAEAFGGGPNVDSVLMGISAGWRDVYNAGLAFQWVDVSDVPPGVYWLRSEVDPDNVMAESDENNPPAFAAAPSVIPGWTAQPLSVPVQGGVPTPFDLQASVVQGPGQGEQAGPVRFRIVTPPAHGTLSAAPGQALAAPTVTYTPAPGYSGPDSFSYAAFSATSPFPLTPVVATAAVTVGPPSPAVSLGGVPGQVTTGTSVQLTATVSGAPDGVAWSVSGVPSGNADVGTITPGGLYTAPARVPAGGTVSVRASSTASPGAAAQAPIAIVAAPVPRPAPSPPRTVSTTKRLPALGHLVVARRGRALLVRAVPGKAGVFRVQARAGASVLKGLQRPRDSGPGHHLSRGRAASHRAARRAAHRHPDGGRPPAGRPPDPPALIFLAAAVIHRAAPHESPGA